MVLNLKGQLPFVNYQSEPRRYWCITVVKRDNGPLDSISIDEACEISVVESYRLRENNILMQNMIKNPFIPHIYSILLCTFYLRTIRIRDW